jgi:hypothetical protein
VSERLDTVARVFVDKREERDRLKASYEAAEKEFKSAQQDMWDHMDDQGLTTFTQDLGPGYGKVQIQKRETKKGIVIDKARAVQAIREAGLEEALLGESEIRQAALSEHVRDWLASGQEMPEGVDFAVRRYVSYSRK